MTRFTWAALVTCFWTGSAWAGSAQYKDLVLADRPATYLRFEETSGTVATNSADWGTASWTSTSEWTYVGTPTFSAVGPFADGSKAVGLGGGNCIRTFGASHDTLAQDVFVRDWTIEMWVRHRTLGEAKDLFSKYNRLSFSFTADNKLKMAAAGAGCAVGTVDILFNDTKWHHLAVVSNHEAATLTYYKDGVQAAQLGSCTYAETQGSTLQAFGTASSSSCSLAAEVDVDEMALYYWPLSAARIAEHFRAARSCISTSSGWAGDCGTSPRGLVGTDSVGTKGGIISEVTKTLDFGTSYAYDGTICTAPALGAVVASGPRQWVGKCTGDSGTIEVSTQLPEGFVPKSGVSVGVWSINTNAAPAMHKFQPRCSCTPPSGSETTWADSAASALIRMESLAQNGAIRANGPMIACKPACDPGDMLRVILVPQVGWVQTTDLGILGLSLSLKVHPTGDF